MQKIIIRCISNCSLVGKYHIIILDKYNNKIFNEYTKCGITKLNLNEDVYKIIITPLYICSSIVSTSFIVNDKINYFDFCFNSINNLLKITAILEDKNYDNLPIERGKIKLWQDHIQ